MYQFFKLFDMIRLNRVPISQLNVFEIRLRKRYFLKLIGKIRWQN